MKQRIESFDLLRGWAIMLMILAHVNLIWLAEGDKWFYALQYIILNPLGVPGFVFVSGLSFGFSAYLKQQKKWAKKDLHQYTFSRTMVIFIIALIFNLVGIFIHNDPWTHIWFWYILQTIAMCRLVGQAFLYQSRKVKTIVTIAFLALTPFLLDFLQALSTESAIGGALYFIAFNPVEANSIFFYFPFFLVGGVIGETVSEFLLYQKSAQEQNLEGQSAHPEIGKMLKIWFGSGIVCLTLGILFGLQMQSENFYWPLIEYINTHPDWLITAAPRLFALNSEAWLLYSMGWLLVVFSLLFYWVDIREKLPSVSFFVLYGRYSLTIYLVHYLYYLIPIELSYQMFPIGFFAAAFIMYALVFLSDKFTKGKASIEFVVVLGANGLYDLIRGQPDWDIKAKLKAPRD